MEAVISSLGSSKVTAQIKSNDFMQGNPYAPPASLISKVANPLEMYESGRKSTSRQQHTTMQPQPHHQVVNNITSLVSTDKYDTYGGNKSSFMFLILYQIDPVISVYKPCDADAAVDKFKEDCKLSLEGDKQLFRKHGFSRKRGLTPDDIRKGLDQGDAMTDDGITYMAKLVQKHIIVYNESTKERGDYNGTAPTTVLFVKSASSRFRMYRGPEESIPKELFTLYSATVGTITASDITNMKLPDLHCFGKVLGIKASSRAELVAQLVAKTSI